MDMLRRQQVGERKRESDRGVRREYSSAGYLNDRKKEHEGGVKQKKKYLRVWDEKQK